MIWSWVKLLFQEFPYKGPKHIMSNDDIQVGLTDNLIENKFTVTDTTTGQFMTSTENGGQFSDDPALALQFEDSDAATSALAAANILGNHLAVTPLPRVQALPTEPNQETP